MFHVMPLLVPNIQRFTFHFLTLLCFSNYSNSDNLSIVFGAQIETFPAYHPRKNVSHFYEASITSLYKLQLENVVLGDSQSSEVWLLKYKKCVVRNIITKANSVESLG